MAGPSDYDGSVALDVEAYGQLTNQERMDLENKKLQWLLCTIDEDIMGDLLDYSFALVNNRKTMEQVANELLFMGFCSEEKVHGLCKILAEHIQKKSGEKVAAGKRKRGKEEATTDSHSADSTTSIEITTTRGRQFRGTVGLRAGYQDDGVLFERQTLVTACQAWMRLRHESGQPFLSCIVGGVDDILYAFEIDGKLQEYQEPVVEVRGEIVSNQEHLSDAQVLRVIRSLFTHLGQTTHQTTVRFTYWGNQGYRESFRLRLPNTEHPLDRAATVNGRH